MGAIPFMAIIYFPFNKPYQLYWAICKESRKMFKAMSYKFVTKREHTFIQNLVIVPRAPNKSPITSHFVMEYFSEK